MKSGTCPHLWSGSMKRDVEQKEASAGGTGEEEEALGIMEPMQSAQKQQHQWQRLPYSEL